VSAIGAIVNTIVSVTYCEDSLCRWAVGGKAFVGLSNAEDFGRSSGIGCGGDELRLYS